MLFSIHPVGGELYILFIFIVFDVDMKRSLSVVLNQKLLPCAVRLRSDISCLLFDEYVDPFIENKAVGLVACPI